MPEDRRRLLTDKAPFLRHVTESLRQALPTGPVFLPNAPLSETAAAVLFLMGPCRQRSKDFKPCLIFNKRSSQVRQAGDLCFPGGRVMPRLDACVAGGLRFPFSPLTRWPYWPDWRKGGPQQARRLSLLLAAGLRESVEEMRLNPMRVRFLGPLPLQRLQLLAREIYPMAVWIERQRRFFPNWEVEKIIPVAIDDFLKPDYYARCRIRFDFPPQGEKARETENFPCFRHPDAPETEVLWGATYRMVTNFLELVFGFKPPPMAALPLIRKTLGKEYVHSGNNRSVGKTKGQKAG